MIVTTTNTIEGKHITKYLSIVHGSTMLGANVINDTLASFTDFFGGRSGAYENKIEEAKETALRELEERAKKLGADAVVGVAFELQVSTMVLVMASGTAVTLSHKQFS
jgi:uncharacterized protein YbjQ (UPF0145 family)